MDRFGYVKRAQHGTRMLTWAELRATYGRELVKLANESRYTFPNTLFSVSEAVMYMQARNPAHHLDFQLIFRGLRTSQLHACGHRAPSIHQSSGRDPRGHTLASRSQCRQCVCHAH